MQLGFYFDQTRCIGCFTCVVACKDCHDVPAGPASWMRVECIEQGVYPDLFVAYMARPCYHCENPLCQAHCPAEAISKSGETGIVTVDKDTCLGLSECGICKEVCPYGAPQFGAEPDSRMQKCDLCLGRWRQGEKPVCVEACLMRALDVGSLEELREKYGAGQDAVGFKYQAELGPAVLIKAKSAKVTPLT